MTGFLTHALPVAQGCLMTVSVAVIGWRQVEVGRRRRLDAALRLDLRQADLDGRAR